MNKAAYTRLFWALITAFAFVGCNNAPRQNAKQPCKKLASAPVKYARGFTIDYYDGFKVITVKDPIDTLKPVARYVIHRPGRHYPVGFEDAVLIDTPVRKIVCISTSHVAEMDMLGLLDSIGAVTNVALLYNNKVVEKVNRGQIVNAGNDEVDYEKLVALRPAFVFTSGSYDGGDKLKMKLDALHLTAVLNLDYKEQDPLARAEWLKFVAAFYGRENLADSIFKVIEANYLALKEKTKSVQIRPTVFCNMPFKEIWYMPCGENYTARLIDDAGGNFLWKDATATNGLNLSLDYESVFAKAANADFWINQGFAASMAEIKAADKKNAFFKAFKTGKVFNNNKRNTVAGGFDFWETGAVNPDKILADLIFIFHPEILPGHELYYYQKLQ
jgi:iron complex transport system substrate-binding protein